MTLLHLLLAAQVATSTAGPCLPNLNPCEVALLQRGDAWRASAQRCQVRLDGAELKLQVRTPTVAAALAPQPGPGPSLLLLVLGVLAALGAGFAAGALLP